MHTLTTRTVLYCFLSLMWFSLFFRKGTPAGRQIPAYRGRLLPFGPVEDAALRWKIENSHLHHITRP